MDAVVTLGEDGEHRVLGVVALEADESQSLVEFAPPLDQPRIDEPVLLHALSLDLLYHGLLNAVVNVDIFEEVPWIQAEGVDFLLQLSDELWRPLRNADGLGLFTFLGLSLFCCL